MKFAGGVECPPVMNAAGLEVVGPRPLLLLSSVRTPECAVCSNKYVICKLGQIC
jgi:hypothetical protein